MVLKIAVKVCFILWTALRFCHEVTKTQRFCDSLCRGVFVTITTKEVLSRQVTQHVLMSRARIVHRCTGTGGTADTCRLTKQDVGSGRKRVCRMVARTRRIRARAVILVLVPAFIVGLIGWSNWSFLKESWFWQFCLSEI